MAKSRAGDEAHAAFAVDNALLGNSAPATACDSVVIPRQDNDILENMTTWLFAVRIF